MGNLSLPLIKNNMEAKKYSIHWLVEGIRKTESDHEAMFIVMEHEKAIIKSHEQCESDKISDMDKLIKKLEQELSKLKSIKPKKWWQL